MASQTGSPLPFSPLIKNPSHNHHRRLSLRWLGTCPRIQRLNYIAATGAQGPQPGPKAPPGVDTRIHWENDDEGWIGGDSNAKTPEEQLKEEQNFLGRKFSDLLNSSSDSHYQFLGVSADADVEEIKSAYRRLSKEYHPDTTTLPIKAASEKFMRLKDIYETLSDGEKRNFYDWTLAQEAASREAVKLQKKLEDPYMQEIANYEPVPDLIDRLGDKKVDLSPQAQTALVFDFFAIFVSVVCIIYVVFFKEQ